MSRCASPHDITRARHVDRLAGEPLPSAIEMRPLAGSTGVQVNHTINIHKSITQSWETIGNE